MAEQNKFEETLPKMLRTKVKEGAELIVQYTKDSSGVFAPRTYREFYDEVRLIAAGLLELGVKRGDLVGLISDNRQEWLATDLGILSIGAANVPKGCDTLNKELSYILEFVDCTVTFAENKKQADKIISCKDNLPRLETIVTFEASSEETVAAGAGKGVKVYSYGELAELGKARRSRSPEEIDAEIDKSSGDDIATVIFTSGTTGEPKGVVLSHRNFLCQLLPFKNVINFKNGEIWLSVLPAWHSFERTIEYIIIYHKNAIAYSKPVSSVLMPDFLKIKPHYIAAVPRVWEGIMDNVKRGAKQMGGLRKSFFDLSVSIALTCNYFRNLCFGLLPNYNGRVRFLDALIGFFPWLILLPPRGLAWLIMFRSMRKKLGGRFRTGISGGATLLPGLDTFFNAVGLKLQEGYGITEAAPIVSVRRYRKNRQGTVGKILVSGTEFKITGESGKILPPGHNGILHVRGEQVMKGYYKKPELTATVLSKDGWLNTGDIAMSTRDCELRITGRAKDTIVLRSGENVEPVPVESKLKESPMIHQCMVVGQDQKYLAALIIPNQDMIMSFAAKHNFSDTEWDTLLQRTEINEIISRDINVLLSEKEGFKTYERIFKFKLLPKPFEPGVELSPKMEILRHKVNARYENEILALFS